MKRLTDMELHDSLLQDVFSHLKSAQAALDAGDMETLADAIHEAGFSICMTLPDSFAESAPGAWYEEDMA
ncbi:hypothetical protein [Acidithiobacillus albertensis]|uniref:hypothetical protein n=1 Tax=Acidithiobacillus albertensis TaxID=119978 RepID=UPI001C073B9F|nr:hypothetical protein [Acidithiobacillus albertensis]MBU2743364.1 hypothetical protein [Acidithiobacillus albertensis]